MKLLQKKNTTKAALLLAACFSALPALASGFPVTVDSCGQPLTFTAAPKRAVVHDMNMSEMAFALGLQPSMVGVTGITGWYKATPEFKKQQATSPSLRPNTPRWKTCSLPTPTFSLLAGTMA